ncbi:MAG: hypothetical protein ACTHJ3_01165 [Pararhizobium sp.]
MKAILGAVFATALLSAASPALAEGAVSCGGMAMLGAAQLLCNHVAPRAPTQLCTFKWSLLTSDGEPKTVEGSFLLPPKATNVQVYSGSGFDRALSNPVVLCQSASGTR